MSYFPDPRLFQRLANRHREDQTERRHWQKICLTLITIATAAIAATVYLALRPALPPSGATPQDHQAFVAVLGAGALIAYIVMGIVAGSALFQNPSRNPPTVQFIRTRVNFVYSLLWTQLAILGFIVLLILVFSILVPWIQSLTESSTDPRPSCDAVQPMDPEITAEPESVVEPPTPTKTPVEDNGPATKTKATEQNPETKLPEMDQTAEP